jgi:hypothetical protein
MFTSRRTILLAVAAVLVLGLGVSAVVWLTGGKPDAPPPPRVVQPGAPGQTGRTLSPEEVRPYRASTFSGQFDSLRLLGWDAAGDPVFAARNSQGLKVMKQTAAGPRTLLTAAPGIASIDIADDAPATGRFRHDGPPVLGPIQALALLLGSLLAYRLAVRIGSSILRSHASRQ